MKYDIDGYIYWAPKRKLGGGCMTQETSVQQVRAYVTVGNHNNAEHERRLVRCSAPASCACSAALLQQTALLQAGSASPRRPSDQAQRPLGT